MAKQKATGPRYSRVLVGSDGTDRAGRAVQRAIEVAKALGASVTILGVGRGEKLQSALERQREGLATDGVSIEVRVEDGNAAQVLIEVAEREGFDMLVLGNKGMSGMERLRLGAVPNKVSHHLPCSLLIVKTA